MALLSLDDINPSTERDLRVQKAATILALQRGDVPYCRSLGVDYSIDSTTAEGKQRTLGSAAEEIETKVEGAHVKKGFVTVDTDGNASVRVVLEDK